MLLSWAFLFAQEPVSVHLTEKDGLPDIEFYDVLEDSKGFIWLAADKGLYRYNGKEFKNYTNTEKRGLSVFGLLEDEQGRIWCTNVSGQFFYVENDKLVTFIDVREATNGNLSEFYVENDLLYIFNFKTILILSLKDKKTILKKNHKEYNNFAFGSPTKSGNSYLFNKGDKIFTLDHNREIKPLSIDASFFIKLDKKKYKKQGIPWMFIAKKDTLVWQQFHSDNIFTRVKNNSLEVLDVGTQLKNLRINHFISLKDEFWFCTNDGIKVYTYNNGFTFSKSYLDGKSISKVMIDKDENYWITTLRSGVFVIPNIDVTLFPIGTTVKNISCAQKINDSTLYLGTTKGEFIAYNIKDRTYVNTLLESDKKVSALRYHPQKKQTYVSQDNASQIVKDKDFKVTKSNSFMNAKDIVIKNDSTILYTSYFGVGLQVPETTTPRERKNLSNKRGYTCYKSETSDNVYVSNVDDLIRYDSTYKEQKLRYKDASIFAISMTETSDKTIWVSTFQNGIFGIRNDTVFQNYKTDNGLISNQVSEIKSDANLLWLVTDKGIQLLNPEDGTSKLLTKKDGIPSYKITDIEVFDNQVVFASNIGLFGIEKTTVFKNRKTPEIYFTELKITEKDTVIASGYSLPHNLNRIQIGFNANNFQSSQNITYEHRLLGGNEDWTVLENGVNMVQFNSLSDGNYTFEVRARNTNDTAVSAVKSLAFSIKKPYWEQAWFLGLIILGITGIILLYLKERANEKEKHRKKELEAAILDAQVDSLRLENLRSQMNPHFIFNALNSIQEYIVINKKQEASDYLGRFADLIRGYLNESVNEDTNIATEIEAIETYLHLEKMRFEENFRYRIHFKQNLDYELFSIPTMLIQPYIENAIKHGLLHKKGVKLLSVKGEILEGDSSETKILRCIIEDNGIGRKRSEEFKQKRSKLHQSFATKANEKRLELLRKHKGIKIGVEIKDLFDEEGAVRGTMVILLIPVG